MTMPMNIMVQKISHADSAVSVWVIPTDEEKMIAQHTLSIVKA
jgi:acetate kinase